MELFRLFGSVLIDNDEAIDALKKTNKEGEGVGSKLKKMGGVALKAGAAVGAAAVAGGAALYGMATKAAGATDRIDKMSQKIGLSREGFQEWDFIMSQSGMSVDQLQGGFKALVNNIDQAIDGTGKGAKSFEALGISVKDANGQVRNQEDIFNEAVVALQKMEDGTEKAKLANDLFGRSGSEMMPLLNGAAGSVDEMRQKAHELGLVLGDEAIDAGVVFTDTVDQMKRSFGAVATQIGVSVMPIIQTLLEWVIANMPTIQKVFKTVFDVIQTVVSVAIDVFKTYFLPVLQQVVQWIQDNWPAIKDTMKTVFDAIKQVWDETLKPAFEALWGLIKTIWEIFKAAWPSIQAIVKVAFDYIKTVYNSIIKPVFALLIDVINMIKKKFDENMPAIKKTFENMAAAIKWAYENVIKPAIEKIGSMIEGLRTVINNALTWFDNFKNGIKDKIEWARDKIKAAIDVIKGLFNFDFKWPKLKMPTFSIKGSMNPLKWLTDGVPKLQVNWNAAGAIFDKPAIFSTPYGYQGVGEAGPEAVAPISTLMDYVRAAVREANGEDSTMERLLSLMSTYLPQLANMKVFLDTGEMVGRLQEEMDFITQKELGGVGFV